MLAGGGGILKMFFYKKSIPGASHHPPPCRQRNIVSKMWLACGGIVLIVRFACGSIVLMVCLVDGVFVLIAWLLGWGIVSIVWWMEWCTKKGQGNRRKNLSKTVQTKTKQNLSIYSLIVQDGDDAADAPATFGRRLRSCLYFFVGMIYCFENVVGVWRHCFDSAGDWLLIQ